MIQGIHYFFLFFLIRLLLTYKRHLVLIWIEVGLGIWSLIESIKCVLQLLAIITPNHALFVSTGSFDNPGPLGGFLAIIATISITYLIINRNRSEYFSKYFYVATAYLSVALLLISLSRAAWLACAVAIMICLIKEFDVICYINKNKIKFLIIAAVFMLLLIGVFYLKQDSALGRLHIWKIELLAILERPIYGYGQGSVLGVYGETQANYFKNSICSDNEILIAGCPEYAFNELLKIGIENGLGVMFIVVIVVLFSLKRLFAIYPPFAFGMIVLCVFSMFSYPFSLWQFKLLFTLFMAVALCNCQETKFLVNTDRILSVTIIALLMNLSKNSYDYYRARSEALREWENLRCMNIVHNYDDLLDKYSTLLPLLKDNYRYIYDYGYILHKSGKYDESNQILEMGTLISSDPMFYNIIGKNYEALGYYELAKEKYWHSHYMVPGRLYPLILLEELHLKLGEVDEAKDLLNIINKMHINERNQMMVDLKWRANNSFQTME